MLGSSLGDPEGPELGASLTVGTKDGRLLGLKVVLGLSLGDLLGSVVLGDTEGPWDGEKLNDREGFSEGETLDDLVELELGSWLFFGTSAGTILG